MSESSEVMKKIAEIHDANIACERMIAKKKLDEDMDSIRSYRRDIKKLLARINTYNSYRELSLAKTKLEEAEMWLTKLIK